MNTSTENISKNASNPLPEIRNVDFNSIEDVERYAQLLFDRANNSGLLLPGSSRQSAEAKQIIYDAQLWINNVRQRLSIYPVGDTLRLLDTFDIIHRIGFNSPANQDLVSEHKLSALEAYIHHDKTIDQYTLYRAIKTELNRRNPRFLDKPLLWTSLCLEQWWKNFRTDTPLSDYDTIQQIRILLSEDLFSFEANNQEQFKQSLRQRSII